MSGKGSCWRAQTTTVFDVGVSSPTSFSPKGTPTRSAATRAQSRLDAYYGKGKFSPKDCIDLSSDPPRRRGGGGGGGGGRDVVVKVEPRDSGCVQRTKRRSTKGGKREIMPRAKRGEQLAAAWAMPAFDEHVQYSRPNGRGEVEVECISGTCRLCGKSLVIKSANSSASRTTCERHLVTKHKLSNEEDVQTELMKLQSMATKDGDIVRVQGLAPYKARSEAWKRCVRGLTKFVSRHNQALHLGSKPAFVDFMKTVDPRWPTISARSLGRQVASESTAIIEKYSLIFAEVLQKTNVALTTDIWSAGNQDSYLTVTAHYITEDWQMRAHTLGTQSFNEAHNVDNIMKKLCRVRQ